jgi:hypothetical protein
MKGDFSRNTFDAKNHFSRVLMQQGRVQLDADWNEQASILLHYLQTLAADLIGPYGGPQDGAGFEVVLNATKDNFTIGAGHYSVGGMLCENEVECAYDAQPHYPLIDPNKKPDVGKGNWLVYLDVWERHVTYLEHDRIREVALGGPDTTTRAQVVWQVKVLAQEEATKKIEAQLNSDNDYLKRLTEELAEAQKNEDTQAVADIRKKMKIVQSRIDLLEKQKKGGVVSCDLTDAWPSTSEGRLRARVRPEKPNADPCITAPGSKYRGAENQLYRVEIHEVTTTEGGRQKFTFKWSRDNGSIVTHIVEHKGIEIEVRSARGFADGQWCELTNDAQELRGEPGTFAKVTKVEGDTLTIDTGNNAKASDATKIRCWDQTQIGDVQLVDGAIIGEDGKWLDLEDGVQVEFESGSTYRTGDYWLIPARVATGSIEWPWKTDGQGKVVLDENKQLIPLPQSPQGVVHHYAPLAMLAKGELALCRCLFPWSRQCNEGNEDIGKG